RSIAKCEESGEGESRRIEPCLWSLGPGVRVGNHLWSFDVIAPHSSDVGQVVRAAQIYCERSAALCNKDSRGPPIRREQAHPAACPLGEGEIVQNIANQTV